MYKPHQNLAKDSSEAALAADDSAKSLPLCYPSMSPTPPSFDATHSPATTPTSTPDPPAIVAKRPRGRIFIGLLLLTFVAYFASHLYDGYVRYSAYGEVVGRKIELAPPWEGAVQTLHVREGDYVRQGDPIFVIDSLVMRHRMEMIEDSLNLERAQLASELARLKWEAERVEDAQQLVNAEYYEKWSELLWDQSVLTDLKQKLARAEKLNREDAVALETLESLKHQVAGKVNRTQQLAEAVQSLRRRHEAERSADPVVNDQIKPAFVRIENLQSDLRRVRQLLDQGLVTSPSNGRVTRISKYAGEYVDATEPVIELFVDGSTEIVLYVKQARSQKWSMGDQLDVCIEPARRSVACEVLRLAPEMQKAPDFIMRHYSSDEVLLPIVVRPINAELSRMLIPGSKVRLPREHAKSQIKALANWLRRSPQDAQLAVGARTRPAKPRIEPPEQRSQRTASLR